MCLLGLMLLVQQVLRGGSGTSVALSLDWASTRGLEAFPLGHQLSSPCSAQLPNPQAAAVAQGRNVLLLHIPGCPGELLRGPATQLCVLAVKSAGMGVAEDPHGLWAAAWASFP